MADRARNAPSAQRGTVAIGQGGQLVLWAMRCWLDGRRCWHLVQTEFLATMGLAGGLDALEELEAALAILDAHARRALKLCPDGTAKISPDERLVLQTVEAARAGSTSLMEMGVASLVPPPQQSLLTRHLCRLADFMAQRQLDCRVRASV